jgi:DNA polymerase-3 subunit alpha
MCALLNSEDPNSDKAQEYLAECRSMGIKVVPPDIKLSGPNYSVAEDKVIVTGLSALKGVGDTAVDNILQNRPYSNMAEFFAFTTARTVNKRVIQALARAGGFDSFEFTRKDLYDNYTKHRNKVNGVVKKLLAAWEDEGKDPDGFDVRNYKPQLEVITFNKSEEEFSRKELLLGEKEILGRCYSGSLHEIFGDFFKRGSSLVTTLDKVPQCKVKSKVKIEVIINNKIKEFTIKNGPRVGEKFAKYSIEDCYGNTSELTVWSSDYKKYREVFKDGTPIKAICSVTEYMGTKSLALSVLERRI